MNKNYLNMKKNITNDINKKVLNIEDIKLDKNSYEFKIMQEENIDYILKQNLAFEEGNEYLYYDLNNLISFNDYLKNNKITIKKMYYILYNISNMLKNIEEYLISENSIMLDFDNIYLKNDLNKDSIKFLILPDYNYDFSYSLSCFLIRMLKFVDLTDKKSLELAYKLFICSSKENYTINDLLNIVDEYKNYIYIDSHSETEYYDNLVSNSNIEEEQTNIMSENYNIYEENLDTVKEKNKVNNNVRSKIDDVSNIYEYDDVDTNEEIDANDEIDIDSETKKVLSEEVFDSFDKNSNNFVKTKKKRKLFDFKHINLFLKLDIFKNFIYIFFSIVIPFLYFLIVGKENFIKNSYLVLIFEGMVLLLIGINIVINKLLK